MIIIFSFASIYMHSLVAEKIYTLIEVEFISYYLNMSQTKTIVYDFSLLGFLARHTIF